MREFLRLITCAGTSKLWLNKALLGIALLMATASLLAVDGTELDQITGQVKEKTGFDVVAIQDASLEGFYVLVLADSSVMYASKDLRWFFDGDLLEATNTTQTGMLNHTETVRQTIRMALIDSVDPDSLITFDPLFEEAKTKIYVFTDTSCGYCRKLHNELNDYLDLGISVSYFAYPRAGIGSEAHSSMVSAWCAAKPQIALTELKLGNSIELKTCENSIEQHMDVARHLGLRGTPLIVLENGKTIGGYIPAADLSEYLAEEGLL